MKKISNPLTIIGLFAGIAEVAGTVVLPFVDDSLQIIFIFYVMLFPIFLVGLFFWTLNKNPKVLYAPSDFKDEKNYMELLTFQQREVDVTLKKATAELQSLNDKNPELTKELEPIKSTFFTIHKANQDLTANDVIEFTFEEPIIDYNDYYDEYQQAVYESQLSKDTKRNQS